MTPHYMPRFDRRAQPRHVRSTLGAALVAPLLAGLVFAVLVLIVVAAL